MQQPKRLRWYWRGIVTASMFGIILIINTRHKITLVMAELIWHSNNSCCSLCCSNISICCIFCISDLIGIFIIHYLDFIKYVLCWYMSLLICPWEICAIIIVASNEIFSTLCKESISDMKCIFLFRDSLNLFFSFWHNLNIH